MSADYERNRSFGSVKDAEAWAEKQILDLTTTARDTLATLHDDLAANGPEDQTAHALAAIADQLALRNGLEMVAQARASGELPRLTTRRIG